MKKRLRLIAFAMLASVLIGALYFAFPSREPSYQGKALSEWLRIYSDRREIADQADQALLSMGTNALPFLLKELASVDSPMKRRLTIWVRRHPDIPFDMKLATERQSSAVNAIQILGPVARPAIPTLSVLVTRHETVAAATLALMSLGQDAIPSLTRAVTNDDSYVRLWASIGLSVVTTNPAMVVQLRLKRLNLKAGHDQRQNTSNVANSLNLAGH